MSTSRIPATRRSAPGDTASTRYDFTTCPVADAFRWGSYFTTHPAYSLSILHGYIRRMLDADEEGCEHCSKRHWDTIFQYTYWSRYMTSIIRQDRGVRVLSEDRMQKFFRGCIETVEDGCILWEHIRLLKPSCCAGRWSSQDESLEMTTSSPRWFSSSASSVSKETVSSATQTPLSWSRNTSPKPEATPTSSSPSPQVPAKSDLVLFQPSKVNSLPVNSDWLSRLRKIFGFYWQKFIYRPFVSLYRWFRDTQANRLGHRFGSLLGVRIPGLPSFAGFAPNNQPTIPQKLLEWPSSSSSPATPYVHSVVTTDDNEKETVEDQTPTSRMAKTREEVKDLWWKVMAKILLAEHRERREKEVASGWERASAASVTESRPSSPRSFVSRGSEGTDSSLRPEDCFSTVSGGSVHSEDNGEDRASVQVASNDSSNPEFDEWYAEWFSQWVLETSRKLRSPESECRFSAYSFSSPAASATGSDHEEDTNILTRPSTPTPLSSPTINAPGRGRCRSRSLSGSSPDSSRSPTRRNSSIPSVSSPVSGFNSPRRCRSPSPFCTNRSPGASSPISRYRTPSPLNINNFPLPPSTLSPTFPTSSFRPSSRLFSRPSSRPSSPTPTHPFQPQLQPQPEPRPSVRPMNAKTEDYLSNAHLLRFPATVSARLMMTAETLGVAGEGKRKLVSELQRIPTPVVETKWRRASEEVKGFDWGFGMGSKDGGEEREEGGEEGYEETDGGYETY